jgi:hypothetical protein
MARNKRAPAPAPAPAFATTGELDARLIELRDERAKLIARQIELERILPARVVYDGAVIEERRSAAAKDAVTLLLNGHASDLPKKQTPVSEWRDVIRRVDMIDKAFNDADKMRKPLAIAEEQARLEEFADELKDANRQVALCFLAAEKARLGLDRVVQKIACSYPLPGEGYPMAGRIANRGSQIYQFLEFAVRMAWISQKEFNAVLAEADADARETPLRYQGRSIDALNRLHGEIVHNTQFSRNATKPKWSKR